MAEFIFEGQGTFNGVSIYIEAETLDEAKEKAKNHDFDDYDLDMVECLDLKIDINSGVENT